MSAIAIPTQTSLACPSCRQPLVTETLEGPAGEQVIYCAPADCGFWTIIPLASQKFWRLLGGLTSTNAGRSDTTRMPT